MGSYNSKEENVYGRHEEAVDSERKRELRRSYYKHAQKKADEDTKMEDLKRKNDLERMKLKLYRFGDQLGIHNFRNLDIKDFQNFRENPLRFAVISSTGSGKSSFINTSEMAILPAEEGSARIQTAGKEGTRILEEFLFNAETEDGHNAPVGFRLVDTRGYHGLDSGQILSMKRILYGTQKLGEEIKFRDQKDDTWKENLYERIPERIHGMIVLLKANDPLLANGEYVKQFKNVREFIKPIGLTPVTVITFMDQIEARIDQKSQLAIKASAVTGSPLNSVFFLTNYNPEKMDIDFEMNLKVFSIFKKALQCAERFVKIQKQRKFNRDKDILEKKREDTTTRKDIQTTVLEPAANSADNTATELESKVPNISEKFSTTIFKRAKTEPMLTNKSYDTAPNKKHDITHQTNYKSKDAAKIKVEQEKEALIQTPPIDLPCLQMEGNDQSIKPKTSIEICNSNVKKVEKGNQLTVTMSFGRVQTEPVLTNESYDVTPNKKHGIVHQTDSESKVAAKINVEQEKDIVIQAPPTIDLPCLQKEGSDQLLQSKASTEMRNSSVKKVENGNQNTVTASVERARTQPVLTNESYDVTSNKKHDITHQTDFKSKDAAKIKVELEKEALIQALPIDSPCLLKESNDQLLKPQTNGNPKTVIESFAGVKTEPMLMSASYDSTMTKKHTITHQTKIERKDAAAAAKVNSEQNKETVIQAPPIELPCLQTEGYDQLLKPKTSTEMRNSNVKKVKTVTVIKDETTCEDFFRWLQNKKRWEPRMVSKILKDTENLDIFTVGDLRLSWDDVDKKPRISEDVKVVIKQKIGI